MVENSKKINGIYTDPKNPGSYSGINNLYRAVRKIYPEINKRDVINYLEQNRT